MLVLLQWIEVLVKGRVRFLQNEWVKPGYLKRWSKVAVMRKVVVMISSGMPNYLL